ncbi:unnamed protein product, partial [Staurois parvus]
MSCQSAPGWEPVCMILNHTAFIHRQHSYAPLPAPSS